jgi:SAM-dependent methyltransferase
MLSPDAYKGRLSVVMPCYNEAATLVEVVERVLASPCTGEVLIVDDGSRDETLALARSISDPRVRVFAQPFNMGKGAALRRGFSEATRDFVVVQDADLEYDPADYERLLRPLVAGEADVVYGSRFAGGQERRVLYYWHTLGNKFLTMLSNGLTNLNLTDMETCYKAFRREVIQGITITEDRFGFEPEITAKVAAGGYRLFEVGVSYHGRTYEQGKKITWRDGVRAVYCMVRYSPVWRRSKAAADTGTASFEEADVHLEEALSHLDDVTGNYADWVHSLLEPHLGARVLEVGAGHGTMTERLATDGRTVLATDLSPRCVELLEKRFAADDAVEVAYGDVVATAAGRTFDSAVLVNVLEHIDGDVAALADIKTVLAPGAKVGIFVPAFEGLTSDFDRQVGHVRRYRRSTLATTVSRAGFEVEDIRYVNLPGFFAWWLVARTLGISPTSKGLAGVYDRWFVPVVRRIEARRAPVLGQSLICIGRVPEA